MSEAVDKGKIGRLFLCKTNHDRANMARLAICSFHFENGVFDPYCCAFCFYRLFCARFGWYLQHVTRCRVTMLFYFELGRFAVKLVVEKNEWEPLVNVLSIFDQHNCLVVPEHVFVLLQTITSQLF